jgi:hypothetical protein
MVEWNPKRDQITYFWYLNAAKVDSMFSQINGRLETESTEEKSKALDGKVSTAVEVGGLLARLGIGKLDIGGEVSKAAGTVLSVTSTLSPANKVYLLMEYLQRANQLAVLAVDEIDEKAVLTRIAERPFQILHGRFDSSWGITEREPDPPKIRMASSEARNSKGKALIEVPLLPGSMLPDQIIYDVKMAGGFYPNAMFAQVFVRPGRFVASPIAAWWPIVSPRDMAATYWSPVSEVAPDPKLLALESAAVAAVE